MFGLGSIFSFLSQDHKDQFLGFDRDGLDPLALGAIVFALGFAADYLNLIAGYLFKGIGLLSVALGVLILMDNEWTKKLLNPAMGFVYALIAGLAYYFGTLKTSDLFAYNMHALTVLVPFVAIATFFATISAFSFASQNFKDRLSKQHNGGYRMILAGVVLMLLAPIGALVIVTAALGALVTTLGVLIVVPSDTTKAMLSKVMTVPSVVLMVLALIAASLL